MLIPHFASLVVNVYTVTFIYGYEVFIRWSVKSVWHVTFDIVIFVPVAVITVREVYLCL
jgi:hypothetical protein